MQLSKLTIFIPLVFVALSLNAHANDLIFKCSFKNSKQVSIYKDLDNIMYSFGTIGKTPDLELKRNKNQLDMDLENISGRYFINSIEFKNGIYGYRLATSVDRIADEKDPASSLTVIKNGKDFTALQCMKGSEDGALISIND